MGRGCILNTHKCGKMLLSEVLVVVGGYGKILLSEVWLVMLWWLLECGPGGFLDKCTPVYTERKT
jgi:hypothetical protein